MIRKSILVSFWQFGFCRCGKFQQMQFVDVRCLVLGVQGFGCCIICVSFLQLLFMLLFRRHFCSIFADLGFQRKSLFKSNFADLQILHEKKTC